MIIFFYGEDTYRSRQKLKELKNKFLREVDPQGSSLAVIDGENTTLAEINKAIGTSSLFARKRMVVIERIFAHKDKLIFDKVYYYFKKDFTSAGNAKSKREKSDNIIIFWDDISGQEMANIKLWQFLSKQKYAQNFKPLSNTETTNWLKKEVAARGAKIGHQAAFSLTGLFGSNLWQLDNEINKLISYKQGQDKKLIAGKKEITIEVEDVENLTRGNIDENIFALTDAISHKNKALAMKFFEKEIEAGVTENSLIFMIIRQFRILLQVRQGIDKGHSSRKIISLLKLHPFVVRKCLIQVRNFSLPTLKNILRHLINIDKVVKSGQADYKSALSMLIARF